MDKLKERCGREEFADLQEFLVWFHGELKKTNLAPGTEEIENYLKDPSNTAILKKKKAPSTVILETINSLKGGILEFSL